MVNIFWAHPVYLSLPLPFCAASVVLLRDLHWLRSPERIDFKLAVLIYRWLHGLAPWCLSDYIQRITDSNCRCLQSSSSSQLVIRHTQLSTVGDRAFPVTGSRLWNSLPPMSHQLERW